MKGIRSFSISSIQRSNIGRKPIKFDPKSIEITFHNPYPRPAPSALPPNKHAIEYRSPYLLTIKGPKGQLQREILPFVRLIDLNQGNSIQVEVDFPQIDRQKAMWGTTRAHVANMIQGVTQGWKAKLQMVGVGYRASTGTNEFKQPILSLKLGYANTIDLPIPENVVAKCPTPDVIELEGISKEVVSQFAATIRSYKPPEPYNQKGIFVNGETIAKKKGKKR